MAANIPLEIKQGATFRHRFILKDVNGDAISLVGATARMHIRKYVGDSTTILELTTTNGRIVITGANGYVDLYIDDADTLALTEKDGVYDLFIDWNTGDSSCYIDGPVTIKQAVTHA
jgi:hypothetical protein